MEKVYKIPSGHFTSPSFAYIFHVFAAKKLHAQNSKDEDNDEEDEGQVAQGGEGFSHDGQDVVQALPGLGQLEYAQQTEGAKHRETTHAL